MRWKRQTIAKSTDTILTNAKAIGQGKLLLPNTNNAQLIKIYFLAMAKKVAARLRLNRKCAGRFFIGMLDKNFKWLTLKYQPAIATNDSRQIYLGCIKLLDNYPTPGIIRQVQITALDPQTNYRQINLSEDVKYREHPKTQRIIQPRF